MGVSFINKKAFVRRLFELIHNRKPKSMEFPELDIEWKNFRFNKIKAVVDDAHDLVHKNNKQLSAAVFPYPEMAQQNPKYDFHYDQ